MAWYHGTHICGHDGKINVVGRVADRQWKIDRYFATVCGECKLKKREEERRKASEKALEYEFPELKGTEKQTIWANKIRIEFYDFCAENKIVADNIINAETDARFWIDNRTRIKTVDFVKNYEIKREEKEVEKRMIGEDTVKPSEISHDGVVEIVERDGRICLCYEKDQDFIDLAKKLKYKWNGSMWSRTLSETVGSFSDRAAEVGHELLKNGFCICIHDAEITNKAVMGDYEPEHTRWVRLRKKSTLLAIRWEGMNEELYMAAREIKGSRYDSPSVVVDVSHYKSVIEFAENNGFKLTKAAQDKINDYKRQLAEVDTVNVN